jgi:hypothetical protein
MQQLQQLLQLTSRNVADRHPSYMIRKREGRGGKEVLTPQ